MGKRRGGGVVLPLLAPLGAKDFENKGQVMEKLRGTHHWGKSNEYLNGHVAYDKNIY